LQYYKSEEVTRQLGVRASDYRCPALIGGSYVKRNIHKGNSLVGEDIRIDVLLLANLFY